MVSLSEATGIVGPLSEEPNCFGTMMCRIQWPEAEDSPLRVRILVLSGFPRVRRVYLLARAVYILSFAQ